MRDNQRRLWVSTIGVLALATAISACGSQASNAAQGGPSTAVIRQLIEGYSGGESATTRYQFSEIRMAPPRVLHVDEVYGLQGGTRVWLVRAHYAVYSAAGDIASPDSTCDKKDNTDYYYIYKDEFGKWAEYATSHSGTLDRNVYYGACPEMPGVAIFSTPMPPAR